MTLTCEALFQVHLIYFHSCGCFLKLLYSDLIHLSFNYVMHMFVGAQLVETPKSEFAKNLKDLMVILGQMILETLAFLDTHQRCNHVLKQ